MKIRTESADKTVIRSNDCVLLNLCSLSLYRSYTENILIRKYRLRGLGVEDHGICIRWLKYFSHTCIYNTHVFLICACMEIA